MDITSLALIIARLRANMEDELNNIREVKSRAVKSQDFEIASAARDWEKKIMEMQQIVDEMR